MKVSLREDYQVPAFTCMREAIRAGARSIFVNAPTGSGKTVIASALMEMVMDKGNRANFVVDRLSLVDQTSATFDRYGLAHGVIQASHPRYRPSLPIQVCSVQTLSKRGWPEADIDVIDEAHILHASVKARIASKKTIVVGMSATPFTKGLGTYFDAVVNVTTTRWLIDKGWLVPYRVFSCSEPDMAGVRVKSTGEWDEKEASGKALEVSHLSLDGGKYLILLDGKIKADIEIVQGFAGVPSGCDFRDRKPNNSITGGEAVP